MTDWEKGNIVTVTKMRDCTCYPPFKGEGRKGLLFWVQGSSKDYAILTTILHIL